MNVILKNMKNRFCPALPGEKALFPSENALCNGNGSLDSLALTNWRMILNSQRVQQSFVKCSTSCSCEGEGSGSRAEFHETTFFFSETT